ncbi:glycoside-pentoside-hexuronide (GPH):cation symporter [Salinispira pacifica]|uniref:Melibiose carrier protein, Na+/melibiose symporter n=1 Tax=Salinispira pacifica TaxID=1307761 RepID=V5WHJ3_9SPIO|nr:glycoside-pentoside-hexuronide (GPH):cation symporter [Salinispira pacifica]AHC15075.1 Melibiose carrier protein, Na+/melibiose symporter [Salinispira pacifica]
MNSNLNRFTYGLGTIGRDMVYSLVSMYLIFYLSDILQLSNLALGWITTIIVGARIFDAMNDPVMGIIVDNTRTRWGKFKPWISFGAVSSAVFTVLLFTDFGLRGTAYTISFAVIYLFWGITYTANDISYWSMLPSLSVSQNEREKLGAFARICANLGLFAVVVGIVPVTTALGESLGSMKQAYFVFALIVAGILIAGQSITVFGVREPRSMFQNYQHTTLKGLLEAIFKNDQLLFTAVSYSLFMIGYVTTTSFGLYFFKYAYGNESMYSIFALVLGVSQISALLIFPLISKRIPRRRFYSIATVLVLLGYVVFFFAPMNMIYIGTAGILLFVGQAFIQLLMLLFLSDTIEYGQRKLGRRNESVTFALQPFINKIGGAAASGVVGATIIISGINDAETAADVSAQGLMMMKVAMMVLPLILIVAGYIIYLKKYKISEEYYAEIINDLEQRGDLNLDAGDENQRPDSDIPE